MKATAEQHAAGVKRLSAIFGYKPGEFAQWEEVKWRSFPADERYRRRQRNKAARAARRRNRRPS